MAQVIAQDSIYAVISRFVVIQVAVAVVLYLWAGTAQRAILRADQADVEVQSQNALLEQSKLAIRGKHQMDENVQRIQRVLSQIEKEPAIRIPVSQEDPLWESMLLLNHVLVRLQHARAEERAYQVYQERVAALARSLVLLRTQQQEASQLSRTGTTLDALIVEINALLASRSPHSQGVSSSTAQHGRHKFGPIRLQHEQ